MCVKPEIYNTHIFGGPDGPTNFRWPRSKIMGTYTSDWAPAWNGEPGKMTHTSEIDSFFGMIQKEKKL